MDKEKIYKEIISILDYVEIAVNDEKNFSIIRKKLLDVANDIKRLELGCDSNG